MTAWIFLGLLFITGGFLLIDGLTMLRWRPRTGYTWIGSNYKRLIRMLLGTVVLYYACEFASNWVCY